MFQDRTLSWRRGWPVILGLLILLWVLNTSRVGTTVEGCPDGCVTAIRQQSGPLRVISLNVLHDFPRFRHLPQRLDRIAEEIRRQDADVVCLQEVGWTPHLGNAAHYLAERTGLNYLYLRANGNRWTILFEEGEAILSRYPLRAVTFRELKPRAWFFEHRVALAATASTPWGDVRFFVTHLTNGVPEINHAQAMSLLAFVENLGEKPAVVAGDFNATEGSPQIQALSRQWIDTYRFLHPGDRGATCCADELSAGPSEALEKRIDYVFWVPGTAGASARVINSLRVLDRPFRTASAWLWASDHVGLLTHIQLQP